MSDSKTLRLALAGNPNCGKTTIFNALTGARQKTGNYAGVTVETKEGSCQFEGHNFELTDLPGLYSLTSYSIDEVVARDFLLHKQPDYVINIVDASNLERNLYLSLQFLELGLPTVLVLNMVDQAEAQRIFIDVDALSALLGVPVVKTIGSKGRGVHAILDAVLRYQETSVVPKKPSYGTEVDTSRAALIEALCVDSDFCAHVPADFLASKLLEKDPEAQKMLSTHSQAEKVASLAKQKIAYLEGHFGRDAEIVLSEQRYAWISGLVKETVKSNTKVKPSAAANAGEVLDRLLMNRILGLPIFLGILWLVFQFTFTVGAYPAAWLETFFAWLAGLASSVLPEGGILHSLLVDGIIGGVGGVFSFVPLVVLLFLCISVLEDLGYMSRAAFIMDRFLHTFGLHGQSFLPMMVGFGCSVPAIMAARTLKSPRDRILTILIIPFMSCGAKLPVHVVLAAAFFPTNSGNMVLLMYIIGVAVALISALVLRKTILKGPDTPFVMELPPYRLPTLKGIGWHVWDKTFSYFRKAGTVILAASILIWAATSFPKPPQEAQALIEAGQASELEYSLAGSFGTFIEPSIKPLGFDWKIGISLLTGLAAKEVVVSTMGVLYKLDAAETNDEKLTESLRNDPVMNPLVAFGLMLFVLLVTPCLASLAAIRSEIGWRWMLFSVVFTISVAWLLAFASFQIGSVVPGVLV